MGYSIWWSSVPKFYTIYDPAHCCARYWPLYLTDWGLIFVALYWICITYLHLKVNCGNLLESKCDLVIVFTIKLSYITGLTFSIFIVPLFWITVYEPRDAEYFFLSINQHGMTMTLIVI